MIRTLLLSFDLIAQNEPSVSLSIATILAYIKSKPEYQKSFSINHYSFNLVRNPKLSVDDVMNLVTLKFDIKDYKYIALSCYVWSEYLINPLLIHLRNYGFRGQFIMGGYQIQYSDTLTDDYPEGDIFIKGYAENSFYEVLRNPPRTTPLITYTEPDFSTLPSPILSGEIPIEANQGKVRLETKRGCLYGCRFCAHRDLQKNKVYSHEKQKSVEEFKFLIEKNVKKVNVVDPIFNMGNNYIEILKELHKVGTRFDLSLQTRFELIRGEEGEEFLNLCKELNIILEFGLQSIIDEECIAIGRPNDMSHITNILKKLNEYGIRYEVSLIYGLPYQTVGSFEKSVAYLVENNCPIIYAFPLMLLKGTELWDEKQLWGFKEETLGLYNTPVVVGSNTFSRSDWDKMRKIANSLAPSSRY